MQRIIAGAIIVAIGSMTPALADPVEDFYKGKQIRIVTGAVAGDGYDLWSRLLGRHMGKHIPGRPSILVQNMPGAGTVIAANYTFNNAPKDGTVIGSFSRSLPSQAMLGRPNIKFDPRQFGWVGSPESINRLCAVGRAAKAQSMDDVFKHETVLGGIGASQMPTYVPMMLNKMIGTRFRMVEGYRSTNTVILAIERGEVEGICMSSSTLLGPRFDLIEKKTLKILFNVEERRMAAMPNVPTIFSRLKSAGDRQIVSFLNSAIEYGRPFAVPPGVPANRLAALRTALRRTTTDPGFVADAKQLKFSITYTSPEEMTALTTRMFATPKSIIDRASAMIPKD
ncbi:MAG: Bug family tripartite tricarboxylate transporter substrate binding protein [Xanthobacteraceae bacterium]